MQSPLGCWMLQRGHKSFFIGVCVLVPSLRAHFVMGFLTFLNFLFSFNFTWFHVRLKRCDIFSNTTSEIVFSWYLFMGGDLFFWVSVCFYYEDVLACVDSFSTNKRLFFLQLAKNIKIQFVFISLHLLLSISRLWLLVYFSEAFSTSLSSSSLPHPSVSLHNSVCCHPRTRHAL